MARFIYSLGNEQIQTFEIVGERVVIGRSSSCHLQLPDRRCSRKHAEVRKLDNKYLIHDLSSKNRIYINNEILEGDHSLQPGDQILVGDTLLTFQMDQDSRKKLAGEIERSSMADVDIKLVDDDSTNWGARKGAVAAGQMPPPETPLEQARGEAIGEPLRRLEILYDVADKIRSILDQNRLLEEIGRILRDFLTPDNLVIMLRDERTGDIRSRIVHSVSGNHADITISRSIVEQCMAERVSILVSDASQDARFAASESIAAHRICSAICAPMIHQGAVLGVVYADSKSSFLPYQQEELELVTGIVNQAATAIVNARLHAQLVHQKRLEREMEIARSIQVNILPREAPAVRNFDIWGLSAPAMQVGGDYFDYVVRSETEIVVAIADVSGKGVPAALLSAIMRASLQIFAGAPTVNAGEIISRLNKTICRDATDNMFVSAMVGILDTEKRVFTYSNAGHSYPMLFTPDGRRTNLDKGGIFLGLVEDSEYKVATVALPPGSLLFLYTDGLTDMINRREELFGADRMIQCLEENMTAGARDICNALFETVRKFRANADQFDDCTAVAIKSLASGDDQ